MPGELDSKRAEVLQKGQSRAKDNPGLTYEVRPRGDSLPGVRISHETDCGVRNGCTVLTAKPSGRGFTRK